jgi:hypothetical protein
MSSYCIRSSKLAARLMALAAWGALSGLWLGNLACQPAAEARTMTQFEPTASSTFATRNSAATSPVSLPAPAEHLGDAQLLLLSAGGSSDFAPAISSDGCVVAFRSQLERTAMQGSVVDLFVYDCTKSGLDRISDNVSSLATRAGVLSHAMSANGRYLAWRSGSPPGTPNPDIESIDYLDRATGKRALVQMKDARALHDATIVRVCDGGERLALLTHAPLDLNDKDLLSDLYLIDVRSPKALWLSKPAVGQVLGKIGAASVSNSCREYAFEATNDAAPGREIWFGRGGVPEPVSVLLAGLTDIWAPALSGNGKYIAFLSSNGVTPANTVFALELQSKCREVVYAGPDLAELPQLSDDGRYVAFTVRPIADLGDPDYAANPWGPLALARIWERESRRVLDLSPSVEGKAADGEVGVAALAGGSPDLVLQTLGSNLLRPEGTGRESLGTTRLILQRNFEASQSPARMPMPGATKGSPRWAPR